VEEALTLATSAARNLMVSTLAHWGSLIISITLAAMIVALNCTDRSSTIMAILFARTAQAISCLASSAIAELRASTSFKITNLITRNVLSVGPVLSATEMSTM